jgi:hypothetical protein
MNVRDKTACIVISTDYALMICPISSTIELGRDMTRCPHPKGYHEWVAENPWVRDLNLPRQNEPNEDTESCDEI